MATHSLSVDGGPVNYKTIRLKKQVNACLPASFLRPAVPNVTEMDAKVADTFLVSPRTECEWGLIVGTKGQPGTEHGDA